MIDPHVLVDALFKEVGVNIPENVVREFWNTKRQLGKEPWALQSPAGNDCVPISLYGDGVKVQGTTKMIGLFISFPLWRTYSTRASRWCIFSIEQHRIFKTETMHKILKRVVFSLNLLFSGHDPNTGAELCGGRRFIVTELKGDWEYFKFIFRYSSSWKGLKDICYRCNANGRATNHSQLYYCTQDEPQWHEYNVIEFISKQLGHCNQPCR